jgi:hypothetical protein
MRNTISTDSSHKIELGRERALRSTVERGNVTVPKRNAIYTPKYRKLTHFTCRYAETSCAPHAKMPKNYALYVPICLNVLRSTCQNTEKLRGLRANMPKRPALHMPKCCNALHPPCQNTEMSHSLHATTSNRTNLPIRNFIYHTFKIRIPPEQNTLLSHYKDHSVNFAWSSSLCLLQET